MKALMEENQSLKEEIALLKASNTALMEQLAVGASKDDSVSETTDREGMKESSSSDEEDKENDRQKLLDRIHELESKLYVSEYTMSQEAELQTVVASIHTTKVKQMEKEKKEACEKLEKSEAECKSKQAKVDDLTSQLNALREQHTVLQKRMEENERKQTDKQQLQSLQTTQEMLKQSVSSLQAQVSSLEKQLEAEKKKDHVCVFSSTTEGVEASQLREANRRLEKEVQMTREECKRQIEESKRDQSQMNWIHEYASLLGRVMRGERGSRDLKCLCCRSVIGDVLERGVSSCDVCNAILEANKMAKREAKGRKERDDWKQKVEMEVDLNYKQTIQKRDIALFLLVILLSIVLAIRFHCILCCNKEPILIYIYKYVSQF